jgi:guanylate kinase
MKQALERGEDVMVRVDVQGAATIKKLLPQAVLIFLAPPSIEEQVKRLRERQTETAAERQLRIETVGEEMGYLPLFDYIVMNRQGEVDSAVAQIRAIVTAEKCKVNPRVVELK